MKTESRRLWWENDFLRVRNKKLYLEEKSATEIAEELGTPLFVYSRKQILSNYSALRKAFSSKTALEIRICYAMKANPHPHILHILKDQGAWIDAVSPGEVERALHAGFSPEKIIYTGTSVSSEDLRTIMNFKGLIVNIDAEEQLELMREIKEKSFPDTELCVSLRWNPGIGRGFNPRVVTAGSKSRDGTPIKFGVEEKKVILVFEKAVASGFSPVGLHQHLGSGWTEQDFEGVRSAVDRMIQKAAELENRGFHLEFLDFGGGFGPRYTENEALFPVEKYATYIFQRIEKTGLKVKALAVEPGKYLVGNAGALLVKVEYVKKSYDNLFACVNAGTFNAIPRPAIYAEAHHHIVNCSKAVSDKSIKITVAGNLCETGDVFGKEILMPRPEKGDILAVLNAGAYCKSMASQYNLRPIPPEIMI